MPIACGEMPIVKVPAASRLKPSARAPRAPIRAAVAGATSVAVIELRNCAVKRLPATTSLMAQRWVSAGKIGPSSVVAMPATTKPMCKVIVTADGKRGPGTDVWVWAMRS